MNEIKEIKMVNYQYPDTIQYSGTIIYQDGEMSGTVKNTPGALTEWFIDNKVPQEMWENCSIRTIIKF